MPAGRVTRRAAVSIGSNLGRRYDALAFAIERLTPLFSSDFLVSQTIETEPEGDGLSDQPLYLNAAVVGSTLLEPFELLAALQEIERECGRTRPYPMAPRTLDLDLILLGDEVVDEPGLVVPHPRFRERFFVLGPLAEVAPDAIDPVTGATMASLLRRLLGDAGR